MLNIIYAIVTLVCFYLATFLLVTYFLSKEKHHILTHPKIQFQLSIILCAFIFLQLLLGIYLAVPGLKCSILCAIIFILNSVIAYLELKKAGDNDIEEQNVEEKESRNE